MKVNVCFRCILFSIVGESRAGRAAGLSSPRLLKHNTNPDQLSMDAWEQQWLYCTNIPLNKLESTFFFFFFPSAAFFLHESDRAWSPADWLISRSIENMKGQIEHQMTRCCPVVLAGWDSQRTAVARQRLRCSGRRDKGW